ncbi:hypothetical protein DW047_24110 [Phocaeicola vulgatus]|nr:hypothetical protein DW047_24110 [Phocaeicola vulgatus]
MIKKKAASRTRLPLNSFQIRFKVISKYCLAVLRIAFIQSIFSKEKGKNRRFSKWGCFVHLYRNLALYAIFQG